MLFSLQEKGQGLMEWVIIIGFLALIFYVIIKAVSPEKLKTIGL